MAKGERLQISDCGLQIVTHETIRIGMPAGTFTALRYSTFVPGFDKWCLSWIFRN